jgi:hypothetical protein
MASASTRVSASMDLVANIARPTWTNVLPVRAETEPLVATTSTRTLALVPWVSPAPIARPTTRIAPQARA